jgi:Zn-dependent protease with chaperone function
MGYNESMTPEQFDQIVARLEVEAQRRPALYTLKVVLLVSLGYAYVWGMLLLLLCLVATFLYLVIVDHLWHPFMLRLGIGITIVAVIILRAMWVHFEPPVGVLIRPSQAPRLFRMLDDLRTMLRTPIVHRVLLTSDFNAAISQHPRLGMLGWYTNYLILGLPLMAALSPEQFRAVIAHEMAHLSRQHNRFSAWIYRLRITWMQLMEAFQNRRGLAKWLFKNFINWYAPFLNAYTFVLARAHEYEADRWTVQLVGAKTAAEALINADIKDSWCQEVFWQRYFKPAPEGSDRNPFLELVALFKAHPSPEEVSEILSRQLARPSDTFDTHPSLAERLQAMGYLKEDTIQGTTLPLPSPIQESAAEFFLGSALPTLADGVYQIFTKPVKESLIEHYGALREELHWLETKAQTGGLNQEEIYNMAALKVQLGQVDEAIPYLDKLLADDPDHASANYLKGILLLQGDNPAGIDYLERAMRRDRHITPDACEHIYDFFMAQGKKEEALRYRYRAIEYQQLLEKAEQERSEVTVRDQFAPHGLNREQLESLVNQLRTYRQIKTAYLVRKVLHYFPEEPLLVLSVRPKGFMTSKKIDKLLTALTEEVTYPLPTYVIILVNQNRAFESKFKRVPGAKILG